MCTASEVVLLKRHKRLVIVESIDGEDQVQGSAAPLQDPLSAAGATMRMKQVKRNRC